MQTFDEGRALWSDQCWLGLSARRIWEHIHFGQVNPFAPLGRSNVDQTADFVDVVDVRSRPASLTGLSLGDVLREVFPAAMRDSCLVLKQLAGEASVAAWLQDLSKYLNKFVAQRGLRNRPAAFLPPDVHAELGVSGLRSALVDWLRAHRSEDMLPEQWLGRLRNLGNQGLKQEELDASGICIRLEGHPPTGLDGAALIASIDFQALRLSIRPVAQADGDQLHFESPSAKACEALPRSQRQKKLNSQPLLRDRAMGYTVEVRRWADLFGHQSFWMAFDHRGELLTSPKSPRGLFHHMREAVDLAERHAAVSLPRLNTEGNWSEYRQPGGRHYREWLITLPWFARSFYSGHFIQRNVLIHVRCDIREGDEGRDVLVLHEVQSDWAQRERRQGDEQSQSIDAIARPPWATEWPALALKLMLLHALHLGVSALSWTRADVQVKRWNGRGGSGLRDLYDRILPRECSRLLRPFGRQCETIDVYQPTNYHIEPIATGYMVLDADCQHVTDTATWREALAAIPCGSIDELQPMHGVRIDESLRQAISKVGLYAWGSGIR